MAMRTADFCKRGSAVRYRRRVGRGGRRSQQAHKVGKCFDVREDRRIGSGGSRGWRKSECIIRCSGEKTGRSLVAFLGEQLVRDSHFYVVGFGGEHEQRLVLCLPSETGNGPIIRAAVHVPAEVRVRMAGDTQGGLLVGVGLYVGKDDGVWD